MEDREREIGVVKADAFGREVCYRVRMRVSVRVRVRCSAWFGCVGILRMQVRIELGKNGRRLRGQYIPRNPHGDKEVCFKLKLSIGKRHKAGIP